MSGRHMPDPQKLKFLMALSGWITYLNRDGGDFCPSCSSKRHINSPRERAEDMRQSMPTARRHIGIYRSSDGYSAVCTICKRVVVVPFSEAAEPAS